MVSSRPSSIPSSVTYLCPRKTRATCNALIAFWTFCFYSFSRLFRKTSRNQTVKERMEWELDRPGVFLFPALKLWWRPELPLQWLRQISEPLKRLSPMTPQSLPNEIQHFQMFPQNQINQPDWIPAFHEKYSIMHLWWVHSFDPFKVFLR